MDHALEGRAVVDRLPIPRLQHVVLHIEPFEAADVLGKERHRLGIDALIDLPGFLARDGALDVRLGELAAQALLGHLRLGFRLELVEAQALGLAVLVLNRHIDVVLAKAHQREVAARLQVFSTLEDPFGCDTGLCNLLRLAHELGPVRGQLGCLAFVFGVRNHAVDHLHFLAQLVFKFAHGKLDRLGSIGRRGAHRLLQVADVFLDHLPRQTGRRDVERQVGRLARLAVELDLRVVELEPIAQLLIGPDAPLGRRGAGQRALEDGIGHLVRHARHLVALDHAIKRIADLVEGRQEFGCQGGRLGRKARDVALVAVGQVEDLAVVLVHPGFVELRRDRLVQRAEDLGRGRLERGEEVGEELAQRAVVAGSGAGQIVAALVARDRGAVADAEDDRLRFRATRRSILIRLLRKHRHPIPLLQPEPARQHHRAGEVRVRAVQSLTVAVKRLTVAYEDLRAPPALRAAAGALKLLARLREHVEQVRLAKTGQAHERVIAQPLAQRTDQGLELVEQAWTVLQLLGDVRINLFGEHCLCNGVRPADAVLAPHRRCLAGILGVGALGLLDRANVVLSLLAQAAGVHDLNKPALPADAQVDLVQLLREVRPQHLAHAEVAGDLMEDRCLEVREAGMIAHHHIDAGCAILLNKHALYGLLGLALVAGLLLYKRRKLVKRVDRDNLGRVGGGGKEVLDEAVCVYTAETDPRVFLVRSSKRD